MVWIWNTSFKTANLLGKLALSKVIEAKSPSMFLSLDFLRNMVVSVILLPQHQLMHLTEKAGVYSNVCALALHTVTPLMKVVGVAAAMAAGSQVGRTSRAWLQRFRPCWTDYRRLAPTSCRAGVTRSCTWTRRCSYTSLSRTPPRWGLCCDKQVWNLTGWKQNEKKNLFALLMYVLSHFSKDWLKFWGVLPCVDKHHVCFHENKAANHSWQVAN